MCKSVCLSFCLSVSLSVCLWLPTLYKAEYALVNIQIVLKTKPGNKLEVLEHVVKAISFEAIIFIITVFPISCGLIPIIGKAGEGMGELY